MNFKEIMKSNNTTENTPPKVITIDGPAGSGKSTVAKLLAHKLGWVYVTTGSIYRTLALLFQEEDRGNHHENLERLVSFLNERYRQEPFTGRVYLGEREITHEIGSSAISQLASIYAQDEAIREKLLPIQRKIVFENNGTVIDGRDMGTVVFPDAPVKIFLTASAEERAKRRYKDFIQSGENINFDTVLVHINERDLRDENRSVAPLRPALDAFVIDSTGKSPEDILELILKRISKNGFHNI